MDKSLLKLLVIEDSEADFVLMERQVSRRGLRAQCRRVDTLDDLDDAIENGTWDLVISDYKIPPLNFLDFFRVMQVRLPDVPVIVVSGTIGDEKAVELLKLGVSDFVLKDSLSRLVPAMERCLREKADRGARLEAERTLRESEARYRGLFSANPHPMWVYDLETLAFLEVNDAAMAHYGYQRDEFLAMTIADIRPPEEVPRLLAHLAKRENGMTKGLNVRHWKKDGSIIDVEITSHGLDYGGRRASLVMAHDITERKRAAESQARLVAILEATTDLVIINDLEGRLLYVNRAGRTKFALDPKGDITGHRVADFLPDAATHVVATEGIPTAVREGIWSGESELVSLDGRRISMSQIILAHKTPDGAVQFLSTIARDITEKKQTEEALRASEARHRRLLDSNIIGVAFWNTRGDLLNANELFLKMIGYRRQDLQQGNLSWTDLTPPEYASVDAKALAEMAASGTCEPFEKELIRKDGGRVTVLVGSALLDGPSDTGSSFIMDITERKQAEAKLRLQSAALNAAANAIVITERDGTIVWVNPAFTALSGHTAEEAIGRNPRDLVRSGIHSQAFFKSMWDTILAGESWSGEVTNRRKDGGLYPETQTITPVKDDAGAITHFIAIKADLTEQRQMEAELRQSQKMEAVGQLAGGIAHEFNNLLQALMSMAALLRSRAGGSELAKIGTEIEALIKRGAGVTQQLLVFSRRQPIEKTNLDLAELVRKGSVLLRRLIAENISIVVEMAPEPMSVEGDAGQIQQVLMNLAINGRDAMPGGGSLTLRSGRDLSEVFLEVEDTGHGMDESTRAHIFEPFFTTKEVGKGTGLGLAVVHGIVKQHGGRIEVESAPGKGSRFRVILPAALGQAASEPDADHNAEVPDGQGARVLLVEDEAEVREGIVALLEILGYEVTATGSGEEAMGLPAEPAPDVLLTDITLPGISGSALGRRLRERWHGLRVVLMSGYFEDQASPVEKGSRFLQKPFEMSALARQLHDALEEKQVATVS